VVTAADGGRYLQEYIRRYRLEYERFTAPPPEGGGYPRLAVSPYISAARLECHLAVDGAVLLDSSGEPEYKWHVAGGPAIMADFPETRTPAWVREIYEREGLAGQNIGIYRVVSKEGIPKDVWRGDLGTPVQTFSGTVDGTVLEVFQYEYEWRELIRRLTYGVFDLILDMKLPERDSEFWNPRVIRNLGFFPADRRFRRFFRYAEFLRHTEDAAWETRSIWARVHVDLRRDFAHAVAAAAGEGVTGAGSMAFDKPEPPLGPIVRDRLAILEAAADGLEALLETQGDAPEAVFHDYLLANPVLIDVYGSPESKPRLIYPEGQSPLGKAYVEPDFIWKYPNNTYKLIELEKPGHILDTREGHPRAAVTHGAFQIAEWKQYINRYYNLISSRYPGIAGSYTGALIIGRETERHIGNDTGVNDYMDLLRQQFAVEEVLTYDDLVHRARAAIAQLQALADSVHS
jgi:hypothetical protein